MSSPNSILQWCFNNDISVEKFQIEAYEDGNYTWSVLLNVKAPGGKYIYSIVRFNETVSAACTDVLAELKNKLNNVHPLPVKETLAPAVA